MKICGASVFGADLQFHDEDIRISDGIFAPSDESVKPENASACEEKETVLHAADERTFHVEADKIRSRMRGGGKSSAQRQHMLQRRNRQCQRCRADCRNAGRRFVNRNLLKNSRVLIADIGI